MRIKIPFFPPLNCIASSAGHVFSYQVRIGPVAFQGCRHLGNNEIVHLLSGLRVISGGEEIRER